MELTHSMTDEDFSEDEEDDELTYKLESRQKRETFVHLAGALGLSHLYKKFLSTQDECRQVEVPHCADLPVESCWDVRKCKTVQVP